MKLFVICLSLIYGSSYAVNFAGVFNSINESQTESIAVRGISNITDSIFRADANFSGPTIVKGSAFNGRVKISGPAKLINSKFNALVKFSGPMVSYKVHFNSVVVAYGSVEAKASNFEQQITVYNPKITLARKTYAKNVLFRESKLGNQTLIVDDSVVSGNINFVDKNGTIILRNGGKLLGSVIGGQVFHQ